MSTWQWFAVGLASIAIAIQVTQRRIDAVMIGVVGLLIYHHPILFNWVESKVASVENVAPGAQQSIAIMFFMLVVAGLIVVLIPGPRYASIRGTKDARVAAWIAIGISMSGWAVFAAVVDPEVLWFSTKLELMHISDRLGAGRLHIVAYAFGVAGLVLGFASRSRLAMAAALVPIGIDVFIASYRTSFVLATVACVVLWSNYRPFKRPMFLSLRAMAIVVFSVAGVFLVGDVLPKSQGLIKAGRNTDVEAIAEQLIDGVRLSEPHTVSLLLHTTVEEQVSMPDSHLIENLANQLVPGGVFSNSNFNTIVQGRFFPEVYPYGMSSSIVGEMWAIGGVPGVAVAAAVWGAMLIALSLCLRRCHCASLQAIIAIIVVIVGFYIFRNDLAYTIQLCKRYAGAIFVSWAFACLVRRLIPVRRSTSVVACRKLDLRT